MRTGIKRFLSRRTPPLGRILAVESGLRPALEKWLAWIRLTHPEAFVDIVTCYTGEPREFDPIRGTLFLTHDYRTSEARSRLVEILRGRSYDAIGILCTGDPIMTNWKWFLAAKVPVKVFILNENGDWFWLDRGHVRVVGKFMAYRSGLSGSGVFTQPLQFLLFPFTLAYLLSVALFLHARRILRT